MKPLLVPNREIRQRLLRELSDVRYWKEVAQEYGLPDLAQQYAEEERQIKLEIELLKLKK